MSFLETPRFPLKISFGGAFGPEYQTQIVTASSGHESRNANWDQARLHADVSSAIASQADLDIVIAWFRAVKAKAHGFRAKDWTDFKCSAGQGILGAGVGNGMPVYQLYKRYSAGTLIEDRDITKPVAGTVKAYRGGGIVSEGGGAGQIGIDPTTGLVTFGPDAADSASAVTVGVTTQVVLASNPGLVAGKKLYLTGFTGADAALLNNTAHTINSIAGAGPYTFTLATNTAGKVITVGGGEGRKYPQASDAITWSGEFDVPMRFDTDQMMARVDDRNLYSWGSIPLIEIRA